MPPSKESVETNVPTAHEANHHDAVPATAAQEKPLYVLPGTSTAAAVISESVGKAGRPLHSSEDVHSTSDTEPHYPVRPVVDSIGESATHAVTAPATSATVTATSATGDKGHSSKSHRGIVSSLGNMFWGSKGNNNSHSSSGTVTPATTSSPVRHDERSPSSVPITPVASSAVAAAAAPAPAVVVAGASARDVADVVAPVKHNDSRKFCC